MTLVCLLSKVRLSGAYASRGTSHTSPSPQLRGFAQPGHQPHLSRRDEPRLSLLRNVIVTLVSGLPEQAHPQHLLVCSPRSVMNALSCEDGLFPK